MHPHTCQATVPQLLLSCTCATIHTLQTLSAIRGSGSAEAAGDQAQLAAASSCQRSCAPAKRDLQSNCNPSPTVDSGTTIQLMQSDLVDAWQR
jgi:hypothetical protein